LGIRLFLVLRFVERNSVSAAVARISAEDKKNPGKSKRLFPGWSGFAVAPAEQQQGVIRS